MRCVLLLTVASAVTVGLAGCAGQTPYCGPPGMVGTCADAPETCASCSPGGCVDSGAVVCDPATGRACGRCARCGLGSRLGNRRWRDPFNPGPPAGAITYPYYTNRGPRDFLASSPSSVGP